MSKIWLEEGFCPVDQYHCLMPVSYVPVEGEKEVQTYQKESMACRHVLSGKCDKQASCEFFQKAPEKLDKSVNWYEP